MTMNSVMHLILHLLEEQSSSGRITIVIDACSVNIRQLLIETPLAEANLADFSQQMLEIVLANKRTVLHALLVNHISADGKLPQNKRTPLPELRGPGTVYTIADTYDGIEIIEFRQIVLPIRRSCREFLGN